MIESVKRAGRNQGEGQRFLWKPALFPAIVSCCAFVCFAVVYWYVTATAIYPYYFAGLFFAVPGIVFAVIAYLAGKGKLKALGAIIITVLLAPVFLICSFIYLLLMSLDASFVTVTDASRYERTMKLSGYPEKEMLAIFPERIPDNAENVVFYYNIVAWLDYEETVVLRFSAGRETIKGYAGQAKDKAAQTEAAASSSVKNGWDKVGEEGAKELPADYTVYVIINTGRTFCIVSVNDEESDIIFFAGYYSWYEAAEG